MIRIFLFVFIWAIFAPGSILGQASFRVMQYNLLNFGNSCDNTPIADRYGWLNTILSDYRPQIMGVNELAPNVAYASGIKTLSFSFDPSIDFADFTNDAGSPIVNQLFFSTDIFEYLGVEVIPSFRDINVYHLRIRPDLVQVGGDTTELYLIVTHFKASNSTSDINSRTQSATAIANWRAAHPEAENILLMGDFNLNNSGEQAWQILVNNANAALRFIDPTGQTTGWGGAPFSEIHTQSTRSSGTSCFSGGGLDDRFDFILVSQSINEGTSGIALVPNSYQAYGNDGNSYDVELTCSSSSPVPQNVCGALKQLSDHLPVVLTLEFAFVVDIDDPFESAGIRAWTFTSNQNIGVQLSSRPDLLSKGWFVQLQDLSGRAIYSERLSPDQNRFEWKGTIPQGLYLVTVEIPGVGTKTLKLLR